MANYKLITLTVCTLALLTLQGNDDAFSAFVQRSSLFWECPEYAMDFDATGFTGSLNVVKDSAGVSDKYNFYLASNRSYSSLGLVIELETTIQKNTVTIRFPRRSLNSLIGQIRLQAFGSQGYRASFRAPARNFYLKIVDENNLYLVSSTSDSVSLRKLTGKSVCISPIVKLVDR